jgi:hypothetical protein
MGISGLYEILALDEDTTGTAITINLPYITDFVDISIASPCVITWKGKNLSDNDTIRLTTSDTLPTGLAVDTTYFVARILSKGEFTVSATEGGAEITTSGTQAGAQNALVWYGDPVVAVADTFIVLDSINIPGRSMGNGGDLQVATGYTFLNDENAKNPQILYGDVSFFDVSGENLGSIYIDKKIFNVGGAILSGALDLAGPGFSSGDPIIIPDIDPTNDHLLSFAAQPAIPDSPVTLLGFKVTIHQQ